MANCSTVHSTCKAKYCKIKSLQKLLTNTAFKYLALATETT